MDSSGVKSLMKEMKISGKMTIDELLHVMTNNLEVFCFLEGSVDICQGTIEEFKISIRNKGIYDFLSVKVNTELRSVPITKVFLRKSEALEYLLERKEEVIDSLKEESIKKLDNNQEINI